MRHEAQFWFRSDRARELFRAVSPEMAAEVNPRSRAECRFEEPDTLVLKVQATDVPALRASLNMWLRLINVAQEMQDLITDQENTA
jgi:KEOPS complex subunit Pcc1